MGGRYYKDSTADIAIANVGKEMKRQKKEGNRLYTKKEIFDLIKKSMSCRGSFHTKENIEKMKLELVVELETTLSWFYVYKQKGTEKLFCFKVMKRIKENQDEK